MSARLSGLGFRRRLRAGSVLMDDRGIVYQNLVPGLSMRASNRADLSFIVCGWGIGVRSWRLADKGNFCHALRPLSRC